MALCIRHSTLCITGRTTISADSLRHPTGETSCIIRVESEQKKVFDLIAYTPVFDDKLNLIKLNFRRKTNFLNRLYRLLTLAVTLERRRIGILSSFISFPANDLNGNMQGNRRGCSQPPLSNRCLPNIVLDQKLSTRFRCHRSHVMQ